MSQPLQTAAKGELKSWADEQVKKEWNFLNRKQRSFLLLELEIALSEADKSYDELLQTTKDELAYDFIQR